MRDHLAESPGDESLDCLLLLDAVRQERVLGFLARRFDHKLIADDAVAGDLLGLERLPGATVFSTAAGRSFRATVFSANADSEMSSVISSVAAPSRRARR
jgi:hypothetical protein